MIKVKYALLLLLAMSCFVSILGCKITLGDTRIVYASYAQDEYKSAIRVATNDPIPVTVGATYSEESLGGYYIVSPSDLKAFINAVHKVEGR